MSGGQVGPLLALRWRMIRNPGVQTGLAIAGVLALALIGFSVLSSASADLGRQTAQDVGLGDLTAALDRTGEVAALMPSLMLAFALLCVVAPLAAGGGTELIPESQLVAYPVRVSTLVRLSFILAPLNIAWYLQVLLLAAATSYAIRGPQGPHLPLLVLIAFLAACTALGQAVGWALVGVRRTKRGRRGTWALLGALVAVAAWVIVTDRGAALLDASPTLRVLSAQLRAAEGDVYGAAPVVLILLAATAVGYVAAVRIASWALRRPGDLGGDGPLSRPVERRGMTDDDTVYQVLLRTDRASVWRSPPLRRGIVVLAVLPTAAAIIASLPWTSIALLPPLVASGAALLFGVNALCLDGSGAVWVASQPVDHRLVLRSKARVIAEACAASVALVLVGAALRASEIPDLTDVVAVLGAAVSCTALVVATSMHLSVTRPHRADLRGPRDTPAPPGTMALYSARLALATTTAGLFFFAATLAPTPLPSLVLTGGLLLWAAWSWSRTRRRWDDPAVRARAASTVAFG